MGKLTDAVMQKPERPETNDALDQAKKSLLGDDTKRLNCDVPAGVYKKLQLKAIQNDTSISALVNEWVLKYVNE
jgi:hypothetical protein